jgi:hypothetical protein
MAASSIGAFATFPLCVVEYFNGNVVEISTPVRPAGKLGAGCRASWGAGCGTGGCMYRVLLTALPRRCERGWKGVGCKEGSGFAGDPCVVTDTRPQPQLRALRGALAAMAYNMTGKVGQLAHPTRNLLRAGRWVELHA